jgi:hypothetical protein
MDSTAPEVLPDAFRSPDQQQQTVRAEDGSYNNELVIGDGLMHFEDQQLRHSSRATSEKPTIYFVDVNSRIKTRDQQVIPGYSTPLTNDSSSGVVEWPGSSSRGDGETSDGYVDAELLRSTADEKDGDAGSRDYFRALDDYLSAVFSRSAS